MDEPPDAAFTRCLPKIELHAHLTGSITPDTLHSIWQYHRKADEYLALVDPLEALSKEKSWNIQTFFPLFSSYIYALISTPETIRWSTNSVLYNFWTDGVVYLELRTTPRSSSEVSKVEYVDIVLDCIAIFEHKDEMSTFLILSIDRRNTPEEAMEVVDLALEFRHRGVVGVDLCGDPSKGDVATFSPAFLRAKEAGLKVTLHFAEIPASSSSEELKTLLSFHPDRLGHVICVPEEIQEEVQQVGIGLEMCISCNVQAKLTAGDVGEHHFGRWRGRNCPIVLCVSPRLQRLFTFSFLL